MPEYVCPRDGTPVAPAWPGADAGCRCPACTRLFVTTDLRLAAEPRRSDPAPADTMRATGQPGLFEAEA